MPEGDTLVRVARALDTALKGRVVVAVRKDPRLGRGFDFAGRTIAAVEARGKHLLVRFDDGRALHTHLRMNGSWHLYRPGERGRRPERTIRIALETDAWTAICYEAPTVEELAPGAELAHARLCALGPDILAKDFDLAAARANLRTRPDEALGAALMDQTLVAGIGNIWRCETLYRLRLDPFAPISARDDATLDATLGLARRMMTDSAALTAVGYGRPKLLVHDRSGLPCPRCGSSIRSKIVGALPRHLYFCPGCQTR